jgi:hypothetical protein
MGALSRPIPSATPETTTAAASLLLSEAVERPLPPPEPDPSFPRGGIDNNINIPDEFPILEFSRMLAGSCCSPQDSCTLSSMFPSDFSSNNISSFADIIILAKSFLRADPVALSVAEAHRQVAAGTALRVNHLRISEDVDRLKSIGLSNLLIERSTAIRFMTYQPTASWPITPYAGSLPTDETNLRTLIAGASPLLPSTFVANHGFQGQQPDPALQLPVELHLADDHIKGRGIILPFDVATAAVSSAGFTLHVSPTLIVRKVNKDLGRLCINYSIPRGINCESKKPLLAAAWGAIRLPQVLQWCMAWERARLVFPHDILHAYATDYDSWYKRILNAPTAVCYYATSFLLDDEKFIFLPLVEQFGAQDSGYHSNIGSCLLSARMSARHLSKWGAILACQYADDTMGFLPPSLIDEEITDIKTEVEATAGDKALANHKTRKAAVIDGNGWSWNAVDGTFTITFSILLRMVCVLFLEIPSIISANDPIPLLTLQRLSAYCLRACTAFPSMRSFSRGASHNISHSSKSHAEPLLLPQTIIDINAWRSALQFAYFNASWLITPTHVPILLLPLHNKETPAQLAMRQASSARYINHCDACTTYNGIGFVISNGTGVPNIDGTAINPFAWGSADFPQLDNFLQTSNNTSPANHPSQHADINLLEMIAAILSILALERLLVDQSPLVQPNGRHRGLIHIHTWTDNTSALSWLNSHRSTHPVHSFLLQTISFAMQRSRLLLTFGHVPGILNTTADAISRHFTTPTGPAVQELLSTTTSCPVSRNFVASLTRVSSSASTSPFGPLLDALMGLE